MVFALTVALALGSCGGTATPTATPDGAWQLTSGTHAGSDLTLVRSHPVTIEFDNGSVTGTASCNGYGGTFEINGSSIAIQDLFMTEMACMPPETMILEAAFAEALGSVDTISVDVSAAGEILRLNGPITALAFEPLPELENADLVGTVWELTETVSGDSASNVLGDRAMLEYFTDGSFIATTGCRTLIGTYTESGAGVTTQSMQAEGTCPQEVVDQDTLVVSVLEAAYTVEIVGQRLKLTAAGAETLIYTAAQ